MTENNIAGWAIYDISALAYIFREDGTQYVDSFDNAFKYPNKEAAQNSFSNASKSVLDQMIITNIPITRENFEKLKSETVWLKQNERRPNNLHEVISGLTFIFDYEERSGDMVIYDGEGFRLARLSGCKTAREARSWAKGYCAGVEQGIVNGVDIAQRKFRSAIGLKE